MKIVRVQYTTTAQYAATNRENIRLVAQEVQQLQHPGIHYCTYLLPDGKTFLHLDQFDSEQAHQDLMALESFKNFEAQLWASHLEVEPVLELLELVADSQTVL